MEEKINLKIAEIKETVRKITKHFSYIEEEINMLSIAYISMILLDDEIEDLLEQCLDLRDKKQCKNCFVEMDKEYKYCPNCGVKQDKEKDFEIDENEGNEEDKEEQENETWEKDEDNKENLENLEKTVTVESNVDNKEINEEENNEDDDIQTY